MAGERQPARLSTLVPPLKLPLRLWATILPAGIAASLTTFICVVATGFLGIGWSLDGSVSPPVVMANVLVVTLIGALLGWPGALALLAASFAAVGREARPVRAYVLAGAGAGALHTVIGAMLAWVSLHTHYEGPFDDVLAGVQLIGGFWLPAVSPALLLALFPAATISGALAGRLHASFAQTLGSLRKNVAVSALESKSLTRT